MTNQQINEAIALTKIEQHRCCRCFNHGEDNPATIIKYGAPFCSDSCAERAGDFALEYGQEQIPNYSVDANETQRLIEGLNKEEMEKFICCLDEVLSIPVGEWCSDFIIGKMLKASAKEKAIAYLKMKGGAS